MKALLFDTFGTSNVLYYGDIEEPSIGDNEVLVETKAIGLNFADVYRRKGNYHLEGKPPYILGYEAAGVVVETGEKVKDIAIGDRIAFADVPHANAEFVAVPRSKAIPLPDSVSFELGASLLLQGLTAQYLAYDSYPIAEGDMVLIHAVAGGVGQLLTQIAKYEGATVIGLTSSQEKKIEALKNGADHVYLYEDDWVEEIKKLTNDTGVDVTYDSVGKTLMQSFEVTKIKGTVVFFGMAGGDPEKVDPRMLMDTSKTLTGGDLWNYLTTRSERLRRSQQLFELVEKGAINVHIDKRFNLSEGKEAHDLLESRKSTGKIILLP